MALAVGYTACQRSLAVRPNLAMEKRMSSSSLPSPATPRRRTLSASWRIAIVLLTIVALAAASIIGSRFAGASLGAGAPAGAVFVLALPAFLAGMLSFLSPCCMPVLSAYVAFTLQGQRERLVLMTVAFFCGVATTMVALGATATTLNQLLFSHLTTFTLIGGLVIIAFGVMSILGKGFGGVQLLDRPQVGLAGTYIYGATFALGWSACVGPILGALFTMLATQGLAVLEGALLAFIYALGLGTPLLALSLLVRRIDPRSRLWRALRGRGFSLNLGATTLHLHTTSILSGALLIGVGVLLATGQLSALSRWAVQTPLSQWVLGLETALQRVLLDR